MEVQRRARLRRDREARREARKKKRKYANLVRTLLRGPKIEG